MTFVLCLEYRYKDQEVGNMQQTRKAWYGNREQAARNRLKVISKMIISIAVLFL